VGELNGLQDQFIDDRYLRLREEIHDQYSVPQVDFAKWVLDRAELVATQKRLLDVGTGVGSYYRSLNERLPETQYTGIDLSAGILQAHPAANAVCLADIDALPFASHSFDVVMANHMLFYVSDIDHAIRECKRVMTDESVFIAATNSIQTMPEFQALFRRALLLLSSHVRPNSNYLIPPHNSFTLENGVRRLSRYFFAVVRHDLPGLLVFPQVDPVMAYLDSFRSIREATLPPDVTWDVLMEAMYDQVNRVITLQGELIVSKLSGVLIASDSGGFISGYLRAAQSAEKAQAQRKKR
jgi:SAM-dependent methyltransferase